MSNPSLIDGKTCVSYETNVVSNDEDNCKHRNIFSFEKKIDKQEFSEISF